MRRRVVRIRPGEKPSPSGRHRSNRLLRAAVLGFGLFLACSRLSIGPTIVVTDSDRLPAWSPDGHLVAFISELYDSLSHRHTSLNVVRVSTGNVITIKELGGRIVHDLDWSPDGGWLVLSSTHGIEKVRLSGDSLTRVTSGDHDVYSSWSAVSNRIFFAINGGAEGGVYSITPDGDNRQRWTNPASVVAQHPSCFLRSDTLSVFTYRDSEYCLALYYPGDTVITTVLKCGFSWLSTTRASPDGSSIAFNAHYEGQTTINLYLYSRINNSLKQLNHRDSEGLDFSPDGESLVHADVGKTRGLQIIDLSTGKTKQLTPGHD